MNADQEFGSLINQLRKLWERRSEDLQKINQLQSNVYALQSQLQDSEKQREQLQSSYSELLSENQKLKEANESISNSLNEKEREITRFLELNQSLKRLLDDQSARNIPLSTDEPKISERQSNTSRYSAQISQFKPPPSQTAPAATVSKSSAFIKAAKSELTYQDFNNMISEINLYNRHQQTREEAVANVRKLLCPAHRELFEKFLSMISGI